MNDISISRIISILFLLGLTGLCQAQSFTILKYSVPEGLPSSEVYEVYQDSRGFVWFATDNGVAQYDGYKMQVYHSEHGLSDPAVFGFHEDSKGRLWFRTYSGKLSYWQDGAIHKYRFNEKLKELISNSIINSFHIDSTEQLWFAVEGLWGRIDSTGSSYVEEARNITFYYKSLNQACLYGMGANVKKPYYALVDSQKISIDPAYRSNVGALICAVKWKNKTLISYNTDLYEHDGSTLRRVITSDTRRVISLSVDRKDRLWVGYMNGGVQRFDSPDLRDPWKPEFLKGVSVTRVREDHEGGFWISSLEKGVFYVPDFGIQNWPLPTQTKIRCVTTFGNYIFVGDQTGNVLALDRVTRTVKWQQHIAATITSFLVDSRNTLWTEHRRIRVEDGRIKLKEKTKWKNREGIIVSDRSYARYFSNFSDTVLWVVGVKRISKYDLKGMPMFRKLTADIYRTMFVDDSMVYLGGRSGLHLYDHNFNFLQERSEFNDYKLSSIQPLNDSILAFTTMGNGFLLVNRKTWKFNIYSLQNEFNSNYIYTATKTDSALWLGTEKGLVKINTQSLLNDNPSYQSLTKTRGLISDKVNFITFAGNEVWAFTDEGFSIFPREVMNMVGEKPRFYIKYLQANDQFLDLRKEVRLPFNQNNIRVAFGFVAFKNPNIFTRHRLKEEDPWVYSNLRGLELYALAPGAYTIELEYSTDNINWMAGYLSPLITIEPPLWKTWYFQFSVVLVVLLIIVLYIIGNVRTYKLHQQKLMQSEIRTIENERSRIAKELHDSVGTDLTAIKMVVTGHLKKNNDPKTDEVEAQMQSTIREIKNIIYGLSPPGLERYGLIAGLKNYVDTLNGTIPIKIEINSFGSEVRSPGVTMMVFRILQELISNSLKHSNATAIFIHINSFGDLLNIVYEDNGRGFTWDQNHNGLGLYNIESRIQSLHGKLKFDSGNFGISYTIDIPLPST